MLRKNLFSKLLSFKVSITWLSLKTQEGTKVTWLQSISGGPISKPIGKDHVTDMPKAVRSLLQCAPLWPIPELNIFLCLILCVRKAFRWSRRICCHAFQVSISCNLKSKQWSSFNVRCVCDKYVMYPQYCRYPIIQVVLSMLSDKLHSGMFSFFSCKTKY